MEQLDRLPTLLAGAALAVYLWRESLRRESVLRREIASLRRENALRRENQSLRSEIASLREARQPDLAEELARLGQVTRNELHETRNELHETRKGKQDGII